jgi:hypothetical protein
LQIVVVCNALLILAGVLNHFNEGLLIYSAEEYYDENGPLTILSFIQLAVIAILCWQILRSRSAGMDKVSWRSPVFLWVLLSCGFVFLAVDEVLMLHERFDRIIHRLLNLEETGVTDRLDDILVGIYGVIGIAVLLMYRVELRVFSERIGLLASGFVLFLAMVVFDVLTNRDDVLLYLFDEERAHTLYAWLTISEESLKVVSEAVFLVAFYDILDRSRRLQHGVVSPRRVPWRARN